MFLEDTEVPRAEFWWILDIHLTRIGQIGGNLLKNQRTRRIGHHWAFGQAAGYLTRGDILPIDAVRVLQPCMDWFIKDFLSPGIKGAKNTHKAPGIGPGSFEKGRTSSKTYSTKMTYLDPIKAWCSLAVQRWTWRSSSPTLSLRQGMNPVWVAVCCQLQKYEASPSYYLISHDFTWFYLIIWSESQTSVKWVWSEWQVTSISLRRCENAKSNDDEIHDIGFLGKDRNVIPEYPVEVFLLNYCGKNWSKRRDMTW